MKENRGRWLSEDRLKVLLEALGHGDSYRTAGKKAGVDKGTAMRYFKLFYGDFCKCGQRLDYSRPTTLQKHRQSCWWERKRRLERKKEIPWEQRNREQLRKAAEMIWRMRYLMRHPGASLLPKGASERERSSQR